MTEEAEQDEEVDKELVDQAKKMIEVLNEKKNLRSAISQKEISKKKNIYSSTILFQRSWKKSWNELKRRDGRGDYRKITTRVKNCSRD